MTLIEDEEQQPLRQRGRCLQKINTMSGGERQRVLVQEPRILPLDKPTSQSTT